MALAPLAAAAALCIAACGAGAQPLPPYRRTPPAPPPAPAPEAASPQVTLTADDVVSHVGGVAQARGNVELKRLDVDLLTDYLEYDQLTDTAHAQGNVRVKRGLDWFDADRVDIEVQQTAGTLTHATYGLGRTNAGGKASRIELVDRQHASAFDADYTSCPRDTTTEPDWVLSGTRIDIDQAKNEGRAEGARLHFLGVPILAAPSMSFPVTAERKSGWLPPTSDFSNASGLTLGVPFYWDLLPNVDTTLTPTIITKRGGSLGAEVRYLGPSDLGQFTLIGLPNDEVYGDSRGSFQWAHEGTRGDLTSYGVRWQQVSDKEYWKDFPHQTAALTQRLLPIDVNGVRRFPLSNGEFDAYVRVQRWQTLQESHQDLPDPDDYKSALITTPYERSPQIGVRGGATLASKLHFDLEAEANRFDLNNQVDETTPRGDGSRLHLIAAVSREWASSWGRIEPRLKINGADYHTDDPMQNNGNRRDASRWIPTFSTDSSISLDRNTTLFGREMVQTLEPRLLYVFTPYHNQDNLPLYDTAPKDFNEVSIYSDNDFTGVDRVSDLNALTAGATTRFNDALNGRELLRLGIAQRFLFKDELVTPGAPDTTRISDLLLWGSSSMVRNWNFDGTLEFNPSSDWTQRAILSTRYSPGPYRVLGATYRYARGSNEQYEVSGQWPIYHRARPASEGGGCGGSLYAVGRVNYSVSDRRVNYAVGGFEYDAGCWVGRLVVERTSTSREEATTHLVLQLELIGLSTLGSGSLRILKDNIPGYQPLHDESASAQVPRQP